MPDRLMDALNKLAKWRSVYASWQLGTRPSNDGETRAVKDHREVTLLLRVEVTALLGLMLKHKVFNEAEWGAALMIEAAHLNSALESKFPGFSTDLDGIHMDVSQIANTMRDLNFPP